MYTKFCLVNSKRVDQFGEGGLERKIILKRILKELNVKVLYSYILTDWLRSTAGQVWNLGFRQTVNMLTT